MKSIKSGNQYFQPNPNHWQLSSVSNENNFIHSHSLSINSLWQNHAMSREDYVTLCRTGLKIHTAASDETLKHLTYLSGIDFSCIIWETSTRRKNAVRRQYLSAVNRFCSKSAKYARRSLAAAVISNLRPWPELWFNTDTRPSVTCQQHKHILLCRWDALPGGTFTWKLFFLSCLALVLCMILKNKR